MNQAAAAPRPERSTVYAILFAISFVHLLNDSIQSVIPAIFPILKESMNLSYLQVGSIAFFNNFVASVMQPVVGLYTDKRPSPYLLPIGMGATFIGMLGLAFAPNYVMVLVSVVLVGIGSAVFHPEGSRVAYMAAGPRRGLAQGIFQVGGNSGQSLAPIMTALIFYPLGQIGAIWFTLVAALAIIVQMRIAKWYSQEVAVRPRPQKKSAAGASSEFNASRKKAVRGAIILLIFLVFARSWYGAGMTNYYPFFIMERYGLTLDKAQIFLFLFLAAGAIGTFAGGPLADRFGRKNVIAFSMLGSAPLAMLLPHVSSFWAYAICLLNGFIILSSFSVTVVYAQELVPGKIGTVSGLIIGLAFGMGAIGSLALGGLADLWGVGLVMVIVGFLPLLGILTIMLPGDKKLRQWAEEAEAAQ